MTKNKSCNIAVLISGNGSNLQAIIDACKKKAIYGQVNVVISDKPAAYGLYRAQQANITSVFCDPKTVTTRGAYDQLLINTLCKYPIDLVVFAGFMRIVGTKFISTYQGKILNIHPSLLPKHQGLNACQQALDAKDTEQGATVHFVTEALDAGPIIVQAKVPIFTDDTLETIQHRIQQQEHKIYPLAISWYAAGMLAMGQRVAYLNGSPISPKHYLAKLNCSYCK